MQSLYDDEDDEEVDIPGVGAGAREEDEEIQFFRMDTEKIPISSTLDGVFFLEDRWGHDWEARDKEAAPLPWSNALELDLGLRIVRRVRPQCAQPSTGLGTLR